MIQASGHERQGVWTPGTESSGLALFSLLWDALAELLGSAAAATLVKRAARRAAVRSPELADLSIRRLGSTYTYSCPSGWSRESVATPPALLDLWDELRPLLVEMTGLFVIRRLEAISDPGIRQCFVPREERL
jgi:hypothetical protein